jgi:hypothetical protein
VNSDRDRTVLSAVESLVGAVLALVGVAIIRLAPGVSVVGVVLVVFGVVGLAHAVGVGVGAIRLPGGRR